MLLQTNAVGSLRALRSNSPGSDTNCGLSPKELNWGCDPSVQQLFSLPIYRELAQKCAGSETFCSFTRGRNHIQELVCRPTYSEKASSPAGKPTVNTSTSLSTSFTAKIHKRCFQISKVRFIQYFQKLTFQVSKYFFPTLERTIMKVILFYYKITKCQANLNKEPPFFKGKKQPLSHFLTNIFGILFQLNIIY